MPFWTDKTLEDLTPAEWEALCDGCGRCCLHKLRDAETDELIYTAVACRLLDTQTCRCTNYARRRHYVRDCLRLTPAMVPELDWLPPSCAYRLRAEGKPLFPWHPLVSGDPDSVHRAGMSVRGRVVPEEAVEDVQEYTVDWPSLPRQRRLYRKRR